MKRVNQIEIMFLLILPLCLLTNCASRQSQFRAAIRGDTIPVYEEFLGKYPESEYTREIQGHLSQLKIDKSRFQDAETQNTMEAYKKFIEKYPDNRFVEEAKKRITIFANDLEEAEEILNKIITEKGRPWQNKRLVKQLGDKGARGIEALVKILTDKCLIKGHWGVATEALQKATGCRVEDFMLSLGLVNHFGFWVTPEEKKLLLAELHTSSEANISPNEICSQSKDWRISMLSSKFGSRPLHYDIGLNKTTYQPKDGYIFLLVKIKAENLDDSKSTSLDTDSLVLVDSTERVYTPVGQIALGDTMYQGRVHIDITPGVRVISNTYVYCIKKSATGLKLRAFDTPAIVLGINPANVTSLR